MNRSSQFEVDRWRTAQAIPTEPEPVAKRISNLSFNIVVGAFVLTFAMLAIATWWFNREPTAATVAEETTP